MSCLNLTHNKKAAKEHSASLSNLVVPLVQNSLAPEVKGFDFDISSNLNLSITRTSFNWMPMV